MTMCNYGCPHRSRLMSKPEVQTLVPLILSRPQILILLLQAHGVPAAFSCLVAAGVVDFNENGHDHVPGDYCQKDLVSSSIIGGIVGTVDLRNFKSQPGTREAELSGLLRK